MASTARKIEHRNDSSSFQAPSGGRRARRAHRMLRIERPLLGDDRIWEREVSGLPAHLLGGLPLPTTLRLEVPGHPGIVSIASSAEVVRSERDSGGVVFDPAEWSALVTAAESDRLWPAELRAICARKAQAPRWTLDLDTALAGARAAAPAGWTIGKVLERVGARLLAAEC